MLFIDGKLTVSIKKFNKPSAIPILDICSRTILIRDNENHVQGWLFSTVYGNKILEIMKCQ
jgi:hypothetical protein